MRKSNQKGQALVEMALIIFLFILLVFGITEFGRAMYTKNSLNNAARAGVRAAVVTSPLTGLPLTYNCGSVDQTNNIQRNICSSIFYIQDMNNVSATVSAVDTLGAPSATAARDYTVTVLVQYTNFQSIVPNLIPITNVLTGEAAMRYE
jgi:Flp pilus assembly protein TadG